PDRQSRRTTRVSPLVDAGRPVDSGRDAASSFKVVIVGSGPAGLSAAAHAAMNGMSHVLLERAPHLNDTIFKYQKRKRVMATPEFLPLRSDLEFRESSREEVIDGWTDKIEDLHINLRLGVEVTSISGEKDNFLIGLANGETLNAEFVV